MSDVFEKYKIEVGGILYFCSRSSDLERDGMFLELSDASGASPGDLMIMEIFYSDQTNKMTVTAFRDSIPLEAVEWLVAQAKERLPPVESDHATDNSGNT